ncbi:MAG: hypothetical protein MUC49_16010 [Raineya sp.]|jgi:hypothetical protein|nr:hypothetical protein [Raineya sp.]
MLKHLLLISVFIGFIDNANAQNDWYIGTDAWSTIIRPVVSKGLYIAPEVRYHKKNIMSFMTVGYDSFQDNYNSSLNIDKYSSKGFFTNIGIDFMTSKNKSLKDGSFVIGLGLNYAKYKESATYTFEGVAFPIYEGKDERNNTSFLGGNIHYGYLFNINKWLFNVGAKHGLAFPWGISNQDRNTFPSLYGSGLGIAPFSSGGNANGAAIATFIIEVKAFFRVSSKE